MKKTVFLALALLSIPAIAQNPPKKIDISKLPTQTRVVEDVIVPVPSEIFTVLDKIGRPNWAAVQRPIKGVAQPLGAEPQQALYLGTVIAEGFIAVEAQDAPEVINIGRSVLKLSQALGVEKAVQKRANAIIAAANKPDWPLVRQELDGALTVVKDALNKLQSPELAHLVSLGGWVRGTEALCEVIIRDYKPDAADLLHQPALVRHFIDRLDGLKDRFKKEPLVSKSIEALSKIQPLIGNEEGKVIEKETVQKIGTVSSDLIKAIQTKPSLK
jgi:hypothetical protein